MGVTSRQRRKQKSGSTGGSARSKRATQKRIKRAAPIQGPAAIRENWDPTKTVRQNYQSLGLIGDLSMRDSGGAEKGFRQRSAPARTTMVRKGKASAKAGMARVERDEEGNIVAVEEPNGERAQTAWGEALNSEDEEEDGVDDDDGEEVLEDDDGTGPAPTAKAEAVLMALDEAAKSIKPVKRFTSDHEHAWLQTLIRKHGQDVEAMTRDRTDNVWQKTPGELRRAIKKAGGMEALQEHQSTA